MKTALWIGARDSRKLSLPAIFIHELLTIDLSPYLSVILIILRALCQIAVNTNATAIDFR
jgi:hypothetical protein